MSPEKVEKSLMSAVEDLEAAVSGLTGEKFGDKESSGSLRRRIAALCGFQVINTPSTRFSQEVFSHVTILTSNCYLIFQILGEGYKMLLTTCLKMPFIK